MRIDVVRSAMDEATNDDDLSATGGASLVGSRRMLFEKIVTDGAAATAASPADRSCVRKNHCVSRPNSSESVNGLTGAVNSIVHSDIVKSTGRSSATEDRISRSSSRVSIRTLPLNDGGEADDGVVAPPSCSRLSRYDDDNADIAVDARLSLGHESSRDRSLADEEPKTAHRSASLSPSPERGGSANRGLSLLDDPAFTKRISYHYAVFSNPKLIPPTSLAIKADTVSSLKVEPTTVSENGVEIDGDVAAPGVGTPSKDEPAAALCDENVIEASSAPFEKEPAVVESGRDAVIANIGKRDVRNANDTSAVDSETKNNHASESSENVTSSEDLSSAKNNRSNLSSSRNIRESVVVSVKVMKTLPDPDYPDDLNPFGDEDEEEQPPEEKPRSSNPFGSDSESDSDECSDKKSVAKVSTNPFDSDSENDEDTPQRSDIQNSSLRKTPVPLPRTMRKPVASPQPSPRPSISQQHSSNEVSPATSCHNLQLLSPRRKLSGDSVELNLARSSGLVNSALRKKKPAPPPPPTLLQKALTNEDTTNSNRNSIIEQTRNTNDNPSQKTMSPPNQAKPVTSPWKNKKGPAPARPIPLRRPVKEMPMEDINTELTDIEVRQQELERQGTQLEQAIREKTEEESAESPAVEEMVLQLFELVNEKNELFRRRSELINMRKMHNLEKEHAELEYQIRCLMLRPESNKTDSDKAKEEELIKKLLETVERRNEIIETMEKDRQRETAEDQSVTTQLGVQMVKPEKKKEKKSKKGKKEKSKECKVDGKTYDSDKHSPTKLIKEKFMTLRHSAKKLHSKGSELEV